MSVNKVNSDGSLLRVAGGTLYADAPIGTISPFGGSTVPNGYLLCDGAEVLKTTYAELYAVIGDAFGTASVNTKFVLPDLRESVPVGSGTRGSGVTNHDTYDVGQFKDDQLQNHKHYEASNAGGATQVWGNIASSSGLELGWYTGTIREGRYGTTTHGKQLGVNYIIKAKMVAVPADIQSAIEKQNSYSTEETYTGKRWIDGKPIYRKVFNNLSVTLVAAQWIDIVDLPTNFDEMIDCDVFHLDSSNKFCKLPILSAIAQDKSKLQYYNVSAASYGGTIKRVIIEYTKTTD